MPTPQVEEKRITGVSGFALLAVVLVLVLGGVALIVLAATGENPAVLAVGIVAVVLGLVLSIGLTAVAPGEARVVQLFGRYVGTIRTNGFRWVNPFTSRHKVSTRIRNHETELAKVNDAEGNPIEIAAVVVWQVRDTAKASFEVDDFVEFVAIQSETAVRHIATSYPYDDQGGPGLSLRQNAEEITQQLSTEIAARVESAGVTVIESRITRLSYAPEIAQAMLRRQQAGAVVAARERIVEGAVGMVRLALDGLAEQNVVELDEERKAAMVSNLLVVLCGDRDTQPIVNAGSLYQ
ncbi:SPFH domain-containing protein [Pseudonocardia pini]|uniref:SPFH domain-containing protein n=1 Tax=Pseudonocardia pini TaxID=2758030 RepID=UPI001FE4E072|nr:SPFH domain-containing protein [Pseudonocardia pini]